MSHEPKPLSAEQLRLVPVILSTSGVEAAAGHVKMSVAEFRARFAVEIEEREWVNEQMKRYDIPKIAAERMKAEDDDYWTPPPAAPKAQAEETMANSLRSAPPLSTSDEAKAVGLLLAGWTLERISDTYEISLESLRAAEPALRKRAGQAEGKMDLDLFRDALNGDKAALRQLRTRKAAKQPAAMPTPHPIGDPASFFTMPGPKGELVSYSKANRDPRKGPVFGRDGTPRVGMLLGNEAQRRSIAEAAVRNEIEQNLLAARREGKV